jgi:hypothetical protein
MAATTRVSPSNDDLFEMRLKFTRPGHQPWTMRRLVWCYHLLADIRTRDAAAEDRFATIVVKLPQLLSFRPFPKSARATIYRNSHDFQPFAGFLISIHSDDMKTCDWNCAASWALARPDFIKGQLASQF